MSDKATESTQTGLFRGSDGKLSIRRIMGVAALLGGIACAVVATFQPGDWSRFVGSGVCMLTGFLLFGMVTVQNITDAAGQLKK